MKAVFLPGNKQVRVMDVPVPEPGPGQVRIRIAVSAICGSDLHTYRRTPVEGQKLFILGHEPSGTVDKLGEGVTHLKLGQRVGMYHYQGCGVCRMCLQGKFNMCENGAHGFASVHVEGGDAEYMVCNAINCQPLPDALSYIDAAFIACIGGTAYGALKKLELNVAKTLVIFGLGPVGLTGIRLAKAMGIYRIIGVDPNPQRREMASGIGADIVLDAEGAAEKIVAITGGGAECVFECSGSAAAQRAAVESARKLGRVAVVGFTGVYDTEGGVNLTALVGRSLTVMGSWVLTMGEYFELVDLMVARNIHFDDLVTHRYKLEDAEEAFRIFDAGAPGQVIFDLQ